MAQRIDSACPHQRRQLIAKDEETEFWECLDCGEIWEPGDQPPLEGDFDQSLSDA
jgi:ribosomal protein L37AE/L43A